MNNCLPDFLTQNIYYYVDYYLGATFVYKARFTRAFLHKISKIQLVKECAFEMKKSMSSSSNQTIFVGNFFGNQSSFSIGSTHDENAPPDKAKARNANKSKRPTPIGIILTLFFVVLAIAIVLMIVHNYFPEAVVTIILCLFVKKLISFFE